MRRAEANLRLDNMENGDFEEAGNDLSSRENVMSHPKHTPHLQCTEQKYKSRATASPLLRMIMFPADEGVSEFTA